MGGQNGIHNLASAAKKCRKKCKAIKMTEVDILVSLLYL